ncbi:MAG: hypothetical protein O3A00_08205 [Planctomycetota bacterium]|nr:hypothetical protein [Planctomycetota bacterium]
MGTTTDCWAPLVYGRTLNVDFRLLAIPEETSREDIDWFQRMVNGAIIYPDALRTGHRWAVFKNERYCAFGLVCMAALVSAKRVVVQTRDLYLFAGYVARIDPTLYPDPPHHPRIPPLGIVDQPPFTVFRTLWDYVDFLWDDTRTSSEELLSDTQKPFRPVPQLEGLLSNSPIVESSSALNRTPGKCAVHSEANESLLWSEAIQSTIPTSLCLRMPDRLSARSAPFENVTIDGIESDSVIDRASGTSSTPRKKTVAAPAQIAEAPTASNKKGNYHNIYKQSFLEAMQDVETDANKKKKSTGDWISYE